MIIILILNIKYSKSIFSSSSSGTKNPTLLRLFKFIFHPLKINVIYLWRCCFQIFHIQSPTHDNKSYFSLFNKKSIHYNHPFKITYLIYFQSFFEEHYLLFEKDDNILFILFSLGKILLFYLKFVFH